MSTSHFDRILVIGSEGQLAQSFKEVLGRFQWLSRARFVGRAELDLGTLEINEKTEQRLVQIFEQQKPTLVLNAMAYTLVDKAETERELCKRLNVVAVERLASLCKKHNAFFVHYSTDYVYPGQGEVAYAEDSPTGPLNYYGETKLEGEKKIQSVLSHYLIFRTSWVVSPFGNNFVKTMLRLAADKEELKIVSDQWGAPTSALDLAYGTIEILKKMDSSGKHSGVYHWVNSGTTNWFELAKFVFDEARKTGASLKIKSVLPIPSADYPTPARRPLNSRLSLSKIKQNFELQPRDWQSAIKEIITKLLPQAKS